MSNIVLKNRITISEEKFDYGYEFKCGIAIVKKNHKFQIIDSCGNLLNANFVENKDNLFNDCHFYKKIIDNSIISYVDKNNYEDTKLIRKHSNNKYGFCSENGKIVIPYIYDVASNFHNGLAFVKNDSECGYINGKNEMLINANIHISFDYDDNNKNILFDYLNNKVGIKFVSLEYIAIIDGTYYVFESIEERENIINKKFVKKRVY